MLSKLNAEQLKFVLSDEPKVLCLAGAGSGKTYSMIARIVHQVEQGVDPESILVLTFTNAAAFEMTERYMKYKPSNVAKVPEFRTFHSFCYSLLNRDGAILRELGYTTLPEITDDATTTALLKTAAMQCGIKMSEKKLMSSEMLSLREEADKQIVLKAYKRLLKTRNLITFDILCYDVCKLFVADSPLVSRYKDQYKYIYVDEMQDTDRRQMDFVESFKNSKIAVVGDALQSIYSFRGADSSIIKSLSDNADWTTYKLSYNYRSTKDIVEFANTFSKSYAGSSKYRIEMKADRIGDEVVVTRGAGWSRRNTVAFLDNIYKHVIEHINAKDGSVAILCRTNAEVGVVTDYLSEHDVTICTHSSPNHYIGALKASIDDEYCKQLLLSKLSSSEMSTYIRQSFAKDKFEVNDILSMFPNNTELITIASAISAIRYIYIQCNTVLSVYQKLAEYIGCDVETTSDILDKMTDIPNVVKYLVSKLETSVDANVYVGTIHSSKGLEYDTVILPGVNDTAFPLSSEDNLNLYYVGITRAKTHLYVYKW